MAYEVVMPYHLHMPSYFLETFTEYPSIIHVLTHFFSEWGKPQEVIELPSDLDIVNVFIMK